MNKKFSTTSVTDYEGNDSYGVIIQDFKSDKEAKEYIKKIKKILK